MKFEEMTLPNQMYADNIVDGLHAKGQLVARVIRDFHCYDFSYNDMKKNSIHKELESYRNRRNSKHQGGHFAATLLVKNKPIELYNYAIGLLIHGNLVTYKAYYEGDSGDDNGAPHANAIPHPTLDSLIAKIRKTFPMGIEKFLPYNEVQPYIGLDSVLGIVFEVDRVRNDHDPTKDEVALDNSLQYLTALYLKLFLRDTFDIELRLYAYSRLNGIIRPAKLNSITIKKCIRYVNVYNENTLDLESIDKEHLSELNRRIARKLDVSFTQIELNELVNDSFASSLKSNDIESKNYFHELREMGLFPKDSHIKKLDLNAEITIIAPRNLANANLMKFYSGHDIFHAKENKEKCEFEILLEKKTFEDIYQHRNAIQKMHTPSKSPVPG